MMQCSILILALLVSCSFSAKLPSEAKKCKRTEENFTECLTEAVQKMVSSLTSANNQMGLVSLEPLKIPTLTIGAGSGAVLLTQYYKDVQIHNYSKAIINKFDIDFEKKTAILEVAFEELVCEAQYSLNGKILLLPVYGDGQCFITLVQCKAVENFNLEEFVKKGKKHFRVISHDTKIIDPKQVIFRFENLFNGNEELSKNIHIVMNENWKELFDDVGHGYAAGIGEVNAGLLNNVFNKFSISDLFE